MSLGADDGATKLTDHSGQKGQGHRPTLICCHLSGQFMSKRKKAQSQHIKVEKQTMSAAASRNNIPSDRQIVKFISAKIYF